MVPWPQPKTPRVMHRPAPVLSDWHHEQRVPWFEHVSQAPNVSQAAGIVPQSVTSGNVAPNVHELAQKKP